MLPLSCASILTLRGPSPPARSVQPPSTPQTLAATRLRSPLSWFRRAGAGEYPLGYHASLDGARGLMTVGVMVAHIHYALYPGSIIFMDTFFMMSAYLITALLLKDWTRHGKLRFWNF